MPGRRPAGSLSDMDVCTICPICRESIEGCDLAEPDGRDRLHPECLARRVPEEAAVALIELLALVALPTVVVWAG